MTGTSEISGVDRTWVEVDLEAVRRNACTAQACLKGVGPGIVAVVKADGYGLGMLPVARAVEGLVRGFAVANVTEARALRLGGISGRVYVLGPALPGEGAALAAGQDFCAAVSDMTEVAALAKGAEEVGKPLAVHVVLDTGMGRMGALPDAAEAVVRAVLDSPWLTLDSVASHFPSADQDPEFTRRQEDQFRQWVDSRRAGGMLLPLTQMANSAALTAYDRRDGEMARAGLMLYGVSPLPEFQEKLSSVMTWRTRVTQVRDLPAGWGVSYGRTFVTPRPMRVATLAVGYADGYPRQASGQGSHVLIHGKRCLILGRVTMDQMMVDVSHLEPAVQPGEEAVLIGRQGADEITAPELAAWAGTIAWDIFTGLGPRVRRVYLNPVGANPI